MALRMSQNVGKIKMLNKEKWTDQQKIFQETCVANVKWVSILASFLSITK